MNWTQIIVTLIGLIPSIIKLLTEHGELFKQGEKEYKRIDRYDISSEDKAREFNAAIVDFVKTMEDRPKDKRISDSDINIIREIINRRFKEREKHE